MKRYRVMNYDFDSRARVLAMEIEDHWEESVKESWRSMKAGIRRELVLWYGPARLQQAERDLLALLSKPFSIVAFHNKFLEQIRSAFLVGAYYPALTGSCSLAERILNHLMIRMREHFRDQPEYKRVYRKDSFDNWDVPIDILEQWGVLLPDAAAEFRVLKDIRNAAIHFDPETDHDDRPRALAAIHSLSRCVELQFGAIGQRPWFIPEIPGASYLTKASEDIPFVRELYLPASVLVGPKHTLEQTKRGFKVHDRHEYEAREVSDEEFRTLIAECQAAQQGVEPDVE